MRIFNTLLSHVQRLAYGGRRSQSAKQLSVCRPFTTLFFLATPMLGSAICALLLWVDPYDIRPWGLRPVLGGYSYPGLEMPRLIRAATGQPHDLILFGGSTTMAISTNQLREAFGSKTPANLSYSLPAPRDTAAVLHHIMGSPSVKRVLLALDHTQMRTDDFMFATGSAASRIMASPWYSAYDFSFSAAQASVNRIDSGVFSTPGWVSEYRRTNIEPKPLTYNADLMHQYAELRKRQPPGLKNAPPITPCTRYRFIDHALIPALEEAKRRRVRVDIFFPPIPYETYALWQVRDIEGSDWTDGARFDQLSRFHQCIAEAVEAGGFSTATVNVTNLNDAIVGKLANFRDTVHLLDRKALAAMLADIALGNYRLCQRNSVRYRALLRERVLNRAYLSASQAATLPNICH